jgi:hypothetical protein
MKEPPGNISGSQVVSAIDRPSGVPSVSTAVSTCRGICLPLAIHSLLLGKLSYLSAIASHARRTTQLDLQLTYTAVFDVPF